MDHHCPWVGNCVALYNHKYFLNFLMHAALGCLVAVIGFALHCNEVGFKKFERENTHYVICMMVSGSLVLSLGGMFGFHAYLILTSGSTLEISQLGSGNPFNRVRKVMKTQAERNARDPIRLFVGTQRAARMARQNAQVSNNQMKEVSHLWANWADVMGSDWRYWAMPFSPEGDMPACDGFNWHLRITQHQ